MRFLQHLAGKQKKTSAKSWFVHACCIHTHIVYKGTAGSGNLGTKKNSGR